MENNITSEVVNQPYFENEQILQSIEKINQIKADLNQLIIGQESLIDFLLISLVAGGNCLIEGVPGIAKTMTAKLLAKSLGLEFSRIQFTPDLMPSDILGTSVFNQKNNDFEYKKGPIFSNIILIDEINRAPAKTQSALFEVMAEKQITMDGTTYILENPFIVFATQNPIEQEGTYRLPEAQLDRFIFNIIVDYPSIEAEIKIIKSFHNRKDLKIEDEPIIKFSKSEIIDIQSLIFNVSIKEELINYIAQIVTNTRTNNSLFLGASPRASLSILNASKANAILNGRNYVIPEDIKKVAPPVLIHRIVLNPEKEMEGLTAKSVINQIIENVMIPR
jgi:MoxR-like ATPase